MPLVLQLSLEKPYAVNSRTSVPVSEGDDLSFRQLLDALGAPGDGAEYTCYVRAHVGRDEEPWLQAYNEQLLNVFVFRYAAATGRGVSVIFRPRISGDSAALLTPEAVGNGVTGSAVPCSLPSTMMGVGDLVQNDIEPFTGEPLSSLPRADLLLLPLADSGSSVAVSWRGLLRHAKRCLVDGDSLFSIVVADVVLTAHVWLRHIVRGAPEGNLRLSSTSTHHCQALTGNTHVFAHHYTLAGADELLHFFGQCCERLVLRDRALRDLHADNKLWPRIKIYTCDLLRMSSSEDAAARLYSEPAARFYLCRAYFTEDEVKRILSFPTACGLSFEELLETVFEKKGEDIAAGRARGQGICSSHDLAPIFEQAFGLRNGFHKEKAFHKDYAAFEKEWKKLSR